MTDKNLAIKLRADGMTYQQIGDSMGVSKQRIYAIIGRRRKHSTDLAKIRNKSLREYFENKFTLSYSAFAKRIGCGQDRANVAKIERFIKNESEARLTAEQWLNFCNETGLSLAELLEVDKCTA